MKPEDYGYNETLEQFRKDNNLMEFSVARVIAEHKERYIIVSDQGECEAEITGNMRFSACGREDFPAVGDWVAATLYDSGSALIHKIFPRSSVIQRQAIGSEGDIQIIAANVDYALLVQGADRDFNINRLERYLTICYNSAIKPIVVITKTDLFDENHISELTKNIVQRIGDIPVCAVSSDTQQGYDELKKFLQKGKTYCMLGSSGAGKSTLLNHLTGVETMKTSTLSDSTNKGRHTTTHREMFVLPNGALMIDNPGMKEVGIANASAGLEATFDEIVQLAKQCRFKDCTHTSESGCAVVAAVENGDIDPAALENFLKLEKEKEHYESTEAERKKKDKDFGKMLKNYKKGKYKDNY
ncbi:MAG: ribosome small subunit-dependent GTPase A [Bacteroidetes bacterium GWF2_43_63]|nr:MAG: ribosome small subunit-dependent GTPase A [Bacteroidetes bacterium GWE2_42_42]OFY56491.1 MAG: ribosome small subunit-dependent GTPase A [Bacteroidetes bacterium GWF2_43_63]HBG71189.1 ribosome small subunit-dependent GTPase A [Bacteroidales bacterium]HCB61272.1 ribosome small subunit-dependent GTPase A [Bacteroidales bacterium]HCY23289.1 ribosome small subunit-dependent GTPase A [Bacteroidales bacterium]